MTDGQPEAGATSPKLTSCPRTPTVLYAPHALYVSRGAGRREMTRSKCLSADQRDVTTNSAEFYSAVAAQFLPAILPATANCQRHAPATTPGQQLSPKGDVAAAGQLSCEASWRQRRTACEMNLRRMKLFPWSPRITTDRPTFSSRSRGSSRDEIWGRTPETGPTPDLPANCEEHRSCAISN